MIFVSQQIKPRYRCLWNFIVKKKAPWKNKKIGFWYKVGKLILVKKCILWIENWNFIWDINEVLLNVITRNHWHFTMWCILNVPRSDMLFNDMVWRIEGMNDMRWYNMECTNFAIMKLFQKNISIFMFLRAFVFCISFGFTFVNLMKWRTKQNVITRFGISIEKNPTFLILKFV